MINLCALWICSAIMGCRCPLYREPVYGAVLRCVRMEEVPKKGGQGQRKGQEKGEREE